MNQTFNSQFPVNASSVGGGKWAQGIEEESDELNEDSRAVLPSAEQKGPGLSPSKG